MTLRLIRRFCNTTRVAFASSICLMSPTKGLAYKHIDPNQFASVQTTHILRTLGASDRLININRFATDRMTNILTSQMVQGMAKGTLTKEEWNIKYMRADALYIYKLGQALAKRSNNENEEDREKVKEFADMFLGYGKHFEKLKKYGLSPNDTLVSAECDDHINLLSTGTTIDEFYIAILTDMIPYVVFANYLLQSIDPSDNNPWAEYAQKYGDLNNKYAKAKLGKTIQIANRILEKNRVPNSTAEKLFISGFTFEEWFIRNAFSKGFTITPKNEG